METACVIFTIGVLAYGAAKMIIKIIKWNDKMIGKLSDDWRPED